MNESSHTCIVPAHLVYKIFDVFLHLHAYCNVTHRSESCQCAVYVCAMCSAAVNAHCDDAASECVNAQCAVCQCAKCSV